MVTDEETVVELLELLRSRIEKLEKALEDIARFRGQLQPGNFGQDNNFATAVAIAESALGRKP